MWTQNAVLYSSPKYCSAYHSWVCTVTDASRGAMEVRRAQVLTRRPSRTATLAVSDENASQRSIFAARRIRIVR